MLYQVAALVSTLAPPYSQLELRPQIGAADLEDAQSRFNGFLEDTGYKLVLNDDGEPAKLSFVELTEEGTPVGDAPEVSSDVEIAALEHAVEDLETTNEEQSKKIEALEKELEETRGLLKLSEEETAELKAKMAAAPSLEVAASTSDAPSPSPEG